MKNFFIYLLFATTLFTVGCRKPYDDSALVGRIDSLESRVAQLEELCQQMNTNISSLQTIINTLQNNDYVTGVTPIVKNGKNIGYTITFTKSQPITIYHGDNGANGINGEKGEMGHTPQIGVKNDADDIYYWTLDGNWLLDNEGNRIKVQGTDGKDGITPLLKIENDYWYVSYDNGSTWSELSKATSDNNQNNTTDINNSSPFQSIDTTNNDYVIFTLNNDTIIKLPKLKSLSITFAIANGTACMPSASIKVGYTLTGADEGTTIETVGDGGWKSTVTKTDDSSGYITVTAPASGGEGKVVMLATTSTGFSAMKAICFEEGVVTGINDAYQVDYEESTLEISLTTNLAYTVNIPDDATSWISVADTRASMRTETLTFTIQENPEEQPIRSATIKLIGECGDILQSFVIMQEMQPSSNPIVFADANAKKVCVEKFDTNGDGELSEKEAAAVTTIDQYFFGDYASSITSFDEFQYFTSLHKVNEYAFYECSNLRSIKLPSGVTTISSQAFNNCYSLQNIVLHEGITEIGSFAFADCSLTSITIPQSITKIHMNAFEENDIESVYISDLDAWYGIDFIDIASSYFSNPMHKGANLYLNNVLVTNTTLPNDYIKTGLALTGCTSITSLSIPNGVLEISDHSFSKCSNLQNISIPESVTSIGQYAFQFCSSLQTITIPKSVSFINYSAFNNCDNLEYVYIKNQTPPTISTCVFDPSLSKIYVPTDSVEAYKTANGWKDYASKIEGYDFTE